MLIGVTKINMRGKMTVSDEDASNWIAMHREHQGFEAVDPRVLTGERRCEAARGDRAGEIPL